MKGKTNDPNKIFGNIQNLKYIERDSQIRH